jgi:hypothetical protein
MASWPAEQILEFVVAVRGRRFFFPFGSLFHMGPSIRAELRSLENHDSDCDCGCNDFRFQDETDIILAEAAALCQRDKRAERRRK